MTKGLEPSQIILGTMRLEQVERSLTQWLDFFVEVHELGIETLHVSSEYESYPLVCRVLGDLAAKFPQITFRLIVKLAAPHFDEPDFSAARLYERLDRYRSDFGIDHIDDVQWMWRHALKDDKSRVEAFARSLDRLADATASLKAKQLIGRLLCFPYSLEFAQVAARMAPIDGLVIYRNVDEVEDDPAVDTCAELGKACIVIRPFAAGKAIKTGLAPGTLLRFALDKPAIEAAILSSSSIEHLSSLIRN